MKKLGTSPRKVKCNSRPRKKQGVRKSRSCGRSKVRYKVRNWQAYNQALRQRGSLTIWMSEEAIQGWNYHGPRQRGAQFRYSDLAIETALTLRAVYHLPFRQTVGFLSSILKLMKVALDVPDSSTLCRRQAGLSISLPVQPSDAPLHIAIDSTGLKVYGEGEWKVRQHGWSKRRTWRKLHLCGDVSTNEITASSLTPNSVTDAEEVTPMLTQLDREVAQASADSAYDKWKVYDAMSDPPHQTHPIHPVIPPQRNARIKQHGKCVRPPLPRDEAIRAIRKSSRKAWKKASGYHQRSLAETGIARYKRIIGPTLQARRLDSQQVETRIGCKILNRVTHLGMPESYPVQMAS